MNVEQPKEMRNSGVHCLPEKATLCSTRSVVVQDAASSTVNEEKGRDDVLATEAASNQYNKPMNLSEQSYVRMSALVLIPLSERGNTCRFLDIDLEAKICCTTK